MNAQFLNPDAIVSTEDLAAKLNDASIRVFECTTYLEAPTQGVDAPYTVRPGRAEYDEGHIPGSAFLDLQGQLSDDASPSHLRFTMPVPQDLGERLKALGVGDDTHVVVYSRGNMQWATRVWWMLYAIGFDNASVLDGGYNKWSQEGREVTSKTTAFAPAASLTVNPRPHAFVGKAEVQGAIGNADVCTINALSAELHRGESERYGRAGRIPGSVNLPATSLQSPADRTFPTPDDAQAAFENIGLRHDQRSIVYCGGGIAATLDAFLMLQLGYENVGVYDASMSEWARDPALAVETG